MFVQLEGHFYCQFLGEVKNILTQYLCTCLSRRPRNVRCRPCSVPHFPAGFPCSHPALKHMHACSTRWLGPLARLNPGVFIQSERKPVPKKVWIICFVRMLQDNLNAIGNVSAQNKWNKDSSNQNTRTLPGVGVFHCKHCIQDPPNPPMLLHLWRHKLKRPKVFASLHFRELSLLFEK